MTATHCRIFHTTAVVLRECLAFLNTEARRRKCGVKPLNNWENCFNFIPTKPLKKSGS